ncbi:hypothetical protein KAS08_04865 [Candidatus Pacearchaeota archaeon]|nr:hypothetical protein [Candidatus Pacearchaeota archaeon]
MSKLAFEIKRKFFHVASLIYLLPYWLILKYLNSQTLALLSLTFILIAFLIMEYLRIIKKKKIPFFHKLWRDNETKKFGGEIPYILGMIIALTFFNFQIALSAILMMAIGDAAATIIGLKFGKHKISENSSIQGSITELIIDLTIGYLIIGNWLIIIPMAIVATLSEMFSYKINDNLTIPILAGLAGQIAKLLLF